jgi:predicted DNA-binding transcriptional regulator AlpA
MTNERFVSEQRAAEMLGLSPRTLLQWRLRGDGPVPHRFGRAVRYAVEDIDEFAARSRARLGGDK